MKITLTQIKKAGACAEKVSLFKELFGRSVELTPEVIAEHGSKFDASWFAKNLLPADKRTDYDRVKDTALAEYNRVKALAWAEYIRVRDTASAEYDRVTDTAWAEHIRVTAPALADYDRVKAPAWAEYNRVTDTALAEYNRVIALASADYRVKCWTIILEIMK